MERTFDDVGPIVVREIAPEWAVVCYRPGYPERATTYHLSYELALGQARLQAYHYPGWKVVILAPLKRVKKDPDAPRSYDTVKGTIVEPL